MSPPLPLREQLRIATQERDSARSDASSMHERWTNTLNSLKLTEALVRKLAAALDEERARRGILAWIRRLWAP